MLDSSTVRIPTHRLRSKTPRHLLTKYKLVYLKDFEKAGSQMPKYQYRVMWYKRDRSIAIRQKTGMKMQVGSTRIPLGVDVAYARKVAQRVRLDFLEQDPTWEDYCSDLLEQCLQSSL